MTEQKQFRTICVDIDTYNKLTELARWNYRSLPKQVAWLVDSEFERAQSVNTIDELDEAAVAAR